MNLLHVSAFLTVFRELYNKENTVMSTYIKDVQ